MTKLECIAKRYSAAGRSQAYTLVEVLIAAAILAIGVMAAATLSLAMVNQQKSAAKMARALNVQEQAARLYQLGIASGSITNLLPMPTGAVITFSNETTVDLPVGDCQLVVCRLVYSAGNYLLTTNSEAAVTREVRVLRPTIR